MQLVFPAVKMVDCRFDNCPITDKGLEAIAKSTALEKLEIKDCAITDQGLKSLGQTRQLKSLSLWGTRVTAEGVNALQRALPTCDIRASVIRNESRILKSDLRSAIVSVMRQNGELADKFREHPYAADSPVPKLVQEEIQRMRKLDFQFLKVMPETDDLLDDDKLPPDTVARITRGLRTLDKKNRKLPRVASWLVEKYQRNRLRKGSWELLAHYMNALTKPET
jgi:hypothetical protein